MRKTAALAAAFLLITTLLNGGLAAQGGKAFAAPGDEISLNAPFLKALITAGVDKDYNGKVTEGEMAAATSLTIAGSAVTDVTGIGYAVNLTALTISNTGITSLPAEISNLTKLKKLTLSSNSALTGTGLPASLWTLTGIEELSLSSQALTTLPAEISNLTALKRLDLSYNALTPAGLPASLWTMTGLTFLDLKYNSITTLPAGVGSLTGLQELNLYHNGLTALPDAIGNLHSLTGLYLQQNSLTVLPATIGNLTGLKTLTLWTNQLTELPAGVFASMSGLTTLDLQYNYLDPQDGSPDRAEIDAAIARGAKVYYTDQNTYGITLLYNGGTGPNLPKSKYYYGESVVLPAATKSGYSLSGWDINGDGSPDKAAGETVVIQPTPLNKMAISYSAIYDYIITFHTEPFGTIDGGSNDITQRISVGGHIATVPAVSANAGYHFLSWYDGQTAVTETVIKAMNVTSSKTFTAKYEADGTIHFADAGFKAALTAAGVDGNSDGFITQAEMQAMTTIELTGGQFTNIAGIGYATNLQTLKLGAGKVATLPTELGTLSALKVLDCSGNKLMILPSGFSGMSGLTTLNLSGNQLAFLPAELGTLSALKVLDCSGNKLAVFPSALSGMSGLTTLNLSGNQLATLPSLAGLTGLTTLNLSGNQLIALPAELGTLSALKVLDCSGNGLTAFPAVLSGMTGLTALNLSDNLLTTLPSLSGLASLTELNVSNNYLDPGNLPGTLPAGAVVTPQKTYAVTLDYKGGTGASLPKTQYYYRESVVLPTATKSGCTFAGWDTDGNGSPDKAAGAALVIQPTPVTTTAVVCNAIYGYTVTFRTQPYGTIGGGTADITQQVIVGSAVTSVPAVAANTGYRFLSWYDGQTAVTEAEIKAMSLTSAKTFMAKFEPVGVITFPDAGFKAALTAAGVDGAIDDLADGFITEAEMQAMTTIELTGGQFTNIAGIGYATNLQTLKLGAGKVAALPTELSTLAALRELDIGGNPIAALPSWLWSMTGLQKLGLSGLGLTTLPAELSTLSALKVLDCSGNRLAVFPSVLSGMSGLTTLNLSGNLLTTLPSLSGLASLTALNVSNNYLNPGNLPATLPAWAVATPQKTCVVSLDYKGGTGSTLPKPQYYYGESIVLPAATKSGYTFAGWDIDGNGSPDRAAGATLVIQPAPITSAVVCNAIYSCAVTFRTDPYGKIGAGTADITQQVIVGSRVTSVPAVTANVSYRFLSWYDGQTAVTEAAIKAMTLTSAKVFVAKYQLVGIITFPDTAFKAALTAAGVDANRDGYITQTEMQARTAIELTGGQFTNIAGIGNATKLQTLKLGAGQVTTLPAELGTLSALKVLDCSGNKLAVFPSVLSGMKGLTTLNLSGNLLTALPSLTGLTSLTALNVSNNYLNPGSLPALPAGAVVTPQKTYAVTLDYKGGTGASLPKSGYYYNEKFTLPATATKAGYTLMGWDSNGDGTIDIARGGQTALVPNPPNSLASKTYAAVYRSSVATLSGIKLSAGAYISPAFSPAVTSYTVTMYDYVGSVTITPGKADTRAAMLLNSKSVASIAVPLSSSAATSTVTVALTAEDGTTKKTYTITVKRAAPSNLNISKLVLTYGTKISPAFSAATTAYTVLVPVSMNSVTITPTRASTASTVYIDGVAASSRAISVGQGLTKVVTVVVKAPLATDKTRTYTLTLKRGVSLSAFTATPKVGTVYQLSPGGTNRMTFSYNMAGPGSVKLEVKKGTTWYVVMSRTETSAGVKTWAWDGKVAGAYLTPTTYAVRITPTANGMAGSTLSLTMRILKYPTVTWGTVANPFRATGTVRTLCSFRVNYVTNAVVYVYNSAGKTVATVRSITNMMPSSAYTTVSWNGMATAGNSALLKAGTLVPTGTYTVRITTGAKVYTKTIKITR